MGQDETLLCQSCGRPFSWTSSEQDFYAARSLDQPRRCPECREEARARRELQGGLQRHPFVGRPR